jgi:hypothetical protein
MKEEIKRREIYRVPVILIPSLMLNPPELNLYITKSHQCERKKRKYRKLTDYNIFVS